MTLRGFFVVLGSVEQWLGSRIKPQIQQAIKFKLPGKLPGAIQANRSIVPASANASLEDSGLDRAGNWLLERQCGLFFLDEDRRSVLHL